MFRDFISVWFDLLLPPRRTEKLLRGISLHELQGLETDEGLPYHDPRVTALVWELKYYASRRAATLAGQLLSERLFALAAEELGAPLLIPVPMHSTRRRERGHNQTELLCKAALFALRSHAAPFRSFQRRRGEVGATPLQYEPRLLARVRATPFQQGLPKQERIKNVKDSMLVRYPEKVAGRVCIVVDDVQTTSATLREAARALKKAGAHRVHLLSFARS